MLLFSAHFPIDLNVKYFWSIFFLIGWVQASSSDNTDLEKFIIEGNFFQAEGLIEELPRESARRHYRAMIKFVRGDYGGSLRELSWRNFTIEQYYPRVCQLKLINLFKTGKVKQFHQETKGCLSELAPFSSNELIWIKSLYHMTHAQDTVQDPFSLGRIGFEIWFKAGMYLQRNELLEKTFLQWDIPKEEKPSMRELLSLHHYRQRRYGKAFLWAQKLSNNNAHNILGRIHLASGNIKASWMHFNKAIGHRKDSLNALEYLPSLAWVLNHWREGRNFLARLAAIRELTFEETALLSAFYIQEGDFQSARKGLSLLKRHFSKTLPLEGLLLGSYISLRLKDGDAMIPYALRACLLSEGISCWILLQQLGWMDFEGLTERNEKVFFKEEPDIEQYRKETEIIPLQEPVFILSKEIEELDRQEFIPESDSGS